MKTIICIASIFCLWLTGTVIVTEGAEWINLFSDSPQGDCYYDIQSVKENKTRNKLAWAKCICLNKKDALKKMSDYKKLGFPKEIYEKYKNYGESFILYEIDCVNYKGTIRQTIDYDKSGNVIFRTPEYKKELIHIPPESMADLLHEKICIKKESPN